jgi:hypothetical protein
VLATNAPVANNNESPGKKGKTISPVSQKIMANKRIYVKVPYSARIAAKCTFKCNKISITACKVSIAILVEAINKKRI